MIEPLAKQQTLFRRRKHKSVLSKLIGRLLLLPASFLGKRIIISDDFRRRSRNDCSRRNVLCDHRAGGDHRIVTDVNAIHNARARADKHIVLHDDISVRKAVGCLFLRRDVSLPKTYRSKSCVQKYTSVATTIFLPRNTCSGLTGSLIGCQ